MAHKFVKASSWSLLGYQRHNTFSCSCSWPGVVGPAHDRNASRSTSLLVANNVKSTSFIVINKLTTWQQGDGHLYHPVPRSFIKNDIPSFIAANKMTNRPSRPGAASLCTRPLPVNDGFALQVVKSHSHICYIQLHSVKAHPTIFPNMVTKIPSYVQLGHHEDVFLVLKCTPQFHDIWVVSLNQYLLFTHDLKGRLWTNQLLRPCSRTSLRSVDLCPFSPPHTPKQQPCTHEFAAINSCS